MAHYIVSNPFFSMYRGEIKATPPTLIKSVNVGVAQSLWDWLYFFGATMMASLHIQNWVSDWGGIRKTRMKIWSFGSSLTLVYDIVRSKDRGILMDIILNIIKCISSISVFTVLVFVLQLHLFSIHLVVLHRRPLRHYTVIFWNVLYYLPNLFKTFMQKQRMTCGCQGQSQSTSSKYFFRFLFVPRYIKCVGQTSVRSN